MIATIFIIFAFIRAFPWSRRRMITQSPESSNRSTLPATRTAVASTDTDDLVPNEEADGQSQAQEQLSTTSPTVVPTTTTITAISIATKITTTTPSSPEETQSHRPPRGQGRSSKFLRYHEVTFGGSVGGVGAESDVTERTPTSSRSGRLVRQARSFAALSISGSSPPRAAQDSPDSSSSTSHYRSALGSHQPQTRASSDYETATSDFYSGGHKSSLERETDAHSETEGGGGRNGDGDGRGSSSSSRGERSTTDNGYLTHYDTAVMDDEGEASGVGGVGGEGGRPDVVDDVEKENADDSYDRDTEEFYSNIQDAAGTSSSSRSKRSSLFSRSDSSATTTSSSGGTFTGGKRRSAASIISSSMGSDIIPIDRRRSSTATEYSVRSVSGQHRRSTGRFRRYISRMTIGGARRRTTGRY